MNENYIDAMWTLARELRAIWSKYAPQRSAELDAKATRERAASELRALNESRVSMGLPTVGEYTGQQSAGAVQWGQTYPAQKTWRSELDAELLAAVKRYLEP